MPKHLTVSQFDEELVNRKVEQDALGLVGYKSFLRACQDVLAQNSSVGRIPFTQLASARKFLEGRESIDLTEHGMSKMTNHCVAMYDGCHLVGWLEIAEVKTLSDILGPEYLYRFKRSF
jgi:hypothetical protein